TLFLPPGLNQECHLHRKAIARKRRPDLARVYHGAADAVPVWPNSFRISRNSNTPFFPAIQRAARSAPRANPSRLRAVWRSVMVSAGESKPISCVPVCAPARLALRVSEPVYPAARISSASFLSVPEGASFLAEW